MGAFDMEFLNFFDSRNISKEHLQEHCFKLESFHSGTIVQTGGRIYLTFSQLLNQLEIIDSPSAMIKMERLNEEVLFFFFYIQENHWAGNRTWNAVSAQLAWSGSSAAGGK